MLDLDLNPAPQVLTELEKGVGLEPLDASHLTLTSLAQYGLLQGGEGRLIAFCPGCLKEPIPYYRRSWCVEFMSFCGTHGLTLQKACPSCRALVRFERLSLDQAFTSCHHCGFDLSGASAQIGTSGEAFQTVITHQDRLAHLLNVPWSTKA